MYIQWANLLYTQLCYGFTTGAQVRTPAILTGETFLIVLAINQVIGIFTDRSNEKNSEKYLFLAV